MSNKLSSVHYAKHLGSLYLNHEFVRCRLSEVEHTTSNIGWDSFFLRPNTDTKEIPGGIQTREAISKWVTQMRKQDLLGENDFDVILAPVRETGREWRTIVVDGTVVSHSLYRKNKRLHEEQSIDAEALRTVERAIEIFHPVDVFAVDVCETADGMKIIEYNNFNSAGLYACDVGTVIDSITAFVGRK